MCEDAVVLNFRPASCATRRRKAESVPNLCRAEDRTAHLCEKGAGQHPRADGSRVRIYDTTQDEDDGRSNRILLYRNQL